MLPHSTGEVGNIIEGSVKAVSEGFHRVESMV